LKDLKVVVLNKGDKVTYLGSSHYKLANGQEVFKGGEELVINSKVSVKKDFFKVLVDNQSNENDTKKEEKIELKDDKKEKELKDMDKDELIKFADDNNIDVDKRKGRDKILKEIKEKM
jgi:hypothetical protein